MISNNHCFEFSRSLLSIGDAVQPGAELREFLRNSSLFALYIKYVEKKYNLLNFVHSTNDPLSLRFELERVY